MIPQAPRTRSEALAQALEWGHTRSHWNEMMELEVDVSERQQTLVRAAQADAAQVQRLAALWVMLPDRLPCETCEGAGHIYEDRDYAMEKLSCPDCMGSGTRP